MQAIYRFDRIETIDESNIDWKGARKIDQKKLIDIDRSSASTEIR